MAMTCPSCSQQYEHRVYCPRCNVALAPHTLGTADGPTRESLTPDENPLPPHWSRNPWGRTVLGVLVSQLLYYALHNVLMAGVLALGDQTNTSVQSLKELLSTQALQVMALLIGSFLAGAGQKNGGLLGSLVGVWNGILCTMLQGLQGDPVTAVNLYGQPILHTAFGAFGGMLGAFMWKPMPTWAPPHAKDTSRKLRIRPLHWFRLTHGQAHWLRILAGAAIAIGGFLWADTILSLVVSNSSNRLSIRDSMQQFIMTLEISALAVFVGGAFAGATTWNGTVQGAWVGLVCSTLFLGFRFGYHQTNNYPTIFLMVAGCLALSLLGGSFGGRLLPPLIVPPATRRYRAMSA